MQRSPQRTGNSFFGRLGAEALQMNSESSDLCGGFGSLAQVSCGKPWAESEANKRVFCFG